MKKQDYDVVILGGALSGASTAILLLQQKPDLRILILEKTTAFGRKVGEATVEVSAYFLTRVLGLTQNLNEHHLVKQGLRFWFTNDQVQQLDQSSEIGGKYLSRVPSFQLDRSVLDEEVLRRAVEAGAQLCRPCTVQSVQLLAGGLQTVHYKQEDQVMSVQGRWVVDASGIAALLARQEGWWRANRQHPTAAVWSRWTGVKDWDGLELAKKFPRWAQSCFGMRGTATNHLIGEGWWAWIIPLKGGDVSVGIVYDQRLVEFPSGGSVGQRLKSFLCAHPVGKEIMGESHWIEGDVFFRRNLPYVSEKFAGDGFVLVGDAAGFLDPFYSPGMDWISFTSSCAARLVLDSQAGACPKKIQKYNERFSHSYRRWFEAIYQDKYYYMGDFELMKIAFLLDLGLYYMGVAAQPYQRGVVAFQEPVFTTPPSIPVFHLMRFYNRRLAKLAEARRRRKTWGRRNHRERFMFPGYSFAYGSLKVLGKAFLKYLWLELKEGWRCWGVSLPDFAVPDKRPAGASTPDMKKDQQLQASHEAEDEMTPVK